MKQKQAWSFHIAAAVLFITGVCSLLVLVLLRSQGAATTSTLTIISTPPSVDTVKLCATTSASPTSCTHIGTGTGLTLTSGTTSAFQIAGRLSDANGFSDIVIFRGSFYNTSIGFTACDSSLEAVANVANCYYKDATSGCTLVSMSATAGYYDCNLAVDYYTTATSADAFVSEQGDATDTWTVRGYAQDTSMLDHTLTALTEVNSIRAIETNEGNGCSEVSYGSLVNGGSTVDSSQIGTDCVLENSGNVDTDIAEYGTDMTCSFGTVPIANQRINITSGSYAAMALGGTDLTVSSQSINVDLDKRNGALKMTDSVFHAITVPATGASGTCAGDNTILAISEL